MSKYCLSGKGFTHCHTSRIFATAHCYGLTLFLPIQQLPLTLTCHNPPMIIRHGPCLMTGPFPGILNSRFKTNPQTPFLPGSGDTGQNRISNAHTISLSVAYFKVWFCECSCEFSIICLFGVLFFPSVIFFEADQVLSSRLPITPFLETKSAKP